MAIGLTAALMRAVPQHTIKPTVVPPVLLATCFCPSLCSPPLGSVARVIAATIIYFGVVLVMGAIPDEVIGAARRLRTLRAPS